MKYCKLTDGNNQTYGGCQWGPMVTHRTSGEGNLCGPGWIHLYTHPLLAAFLNPIHADFTDPNLWTVKTAGKTKTDIGLKFGKTVVTTIHEIPLPVITLEQRVEIGIRCAMVVTHDAEFHRWANRWLDGTDRSKTAIGAARMAAEAALVDAAARMAARMAAEAARMAAEAARTAAALVDAAARMAATRMAATRTAAEAAANATKAAARGMAEIDLLGIIKQVIG